MLAVIAILCIAVGAGASGALNMGYEGDIDALMTRTAQPAGPARPGHAGRRAWPSALTLPFFSVMLLGIAVNWLAAGAAGLHHRLLRRRLHHVAEALDAAEHRHRRRGRRPAAGDRLGGGDRLAVASTPGCCSLIIFLWTPPHFWALALFRSDDYAKAGVPMMPVVAGPEATRLQILLYT